MPTPCTRAVIFVDLFPGAGLTLEAALKPAIITRGGVRVAFFSFSDQAGGGVVVVAVVVLGGGVGGGGVLL
jgi:hypothetical protein